MQIIRFVTPTESAAKSVDVRIVDHKTKQPKQVSGRVLSVMFHGPADAVQQATQKLRKDRIFFFILGV